MPAASLVREWRPDLKPLFAGLNLAGHEILTHRPYKHRLVLATGGSRGPSLPLLFSVVSGRFHGVADMNTG